ncbi:MAG: DNA polymerase III subunit epsilon [Methylococcaceae bacterium]|nr:DNA polymerase III subunit epsilon [Methylococcaceae bacterium]
MNTSKTRYVVLDTETTGLNPEEGHRVIEIGCIEVINRKITGNRFHVYLNPDREIDDGAVAVHGLSAQFLSDKARFPEIRDDFLRFVQGSELLIHNAPFDVGFLNAELARCDENLKIQDYCAVTDTLAMARKKHPGQRNTLDALCKRYDVDNAHRELHGALLDAELLADVFLAMTGGQSSLLLELEPDPATQPDSGTETEAPRTQRAFPPLTVVRASADEETAHRQRLEAISRSSGGRCLWATEG